MLTYPQFLQESCLAKFFVLAGCRHAQILEINQGGNAMVTDKDLYRDSMGNLRPYSQIMYHRKKVRTSMLMPNETVYATVSCTCKGSHVNLRVVMGVGGVPKEIVGNDQCWCNQWFFLRQGAKEDERILRKWAERYIRWSVNHWSKPYIQGSLNRFAHYCKLERADEIRNNVGRKTCVSISLGDMQLSAARVLSYS